MTEALFSVSEFIEYINIAIGRRRVSVSGEISGYHLNQGKWAFFDLKDEECKIGCFALFWNLSAALEDGMEVVVHGIPRIYPKSGKFSIMVDSIELKGEGALRRAYELTKKKLEQEGLFDLGRKRELPRFPEKLGIIASRESAAYTDFMRIVNARWGGLIIVLVHVSVQGDAAVREIVRAFEWFNTQGIQEHVESIALIRGGGSLEDLQAFNTEAVARAVFGSRIPVICGVGHERDESLADYAADVRAATPTHAAMLMVPDREEIGGVLSRHSSTMARSFAHLCEWYTHHIARAISTLRASTEERLSTIERTLSVFAQSGERVRARMTVLRERCDQHAQALSVHMHTQLASTEQSLDFLSRTLHQMNPLTVLKRGYTITKRKNTLVARKKGLSVGDELTITFADGTIATHIRRV